MKEFKKKALCYKIHAEIVSRLYFMIFALVLSAFFEKGLNVALVSTIPLLLVVFIYKWRVGFSYYINNVYFGRIRNDGERDRRYSKHYANVKVNTFKGIEVEKLQSYLDKDKVYFSRFVDKFYSVMRWRYKNKFKARPFISSILVLGVVTVLILFARLYFQMWGLKV